MRARPPCKTENSTPLELFPHCPLAIIILMFWQKKITNLFLKLPYDGLIAETNSPLGQLVLENIGGSRIGLDHDLAKPLETEKTLPLIKIIKRVITTTAYFIHSTLIDRNNNLFNGKRSKLLAKFDITSKPYEKVR